MFGAIVWELKKGADSSKRTRQSKVISAVDWRVVRTLPTTPTPASVVDRDASPLEEVPADLLFLKRCQQATTVATCPWCP